MTRLSVCGLGVSCNEMNDTPMLLVVEYSCFVWHPYKKSNRTKLKKLKVEHRVTLRVLVLVYTQDGSLGARYRGVMITQVFLGAMVAPGTRTFMCPPRQRAMSPTISNTQVTFAYHSFYDNLRLHVPLRHFLIVCYCFYTILNYYVLSKSDVIKITCTHSMAMMTSDGLN